jgi:hypothetical protein
MISIDLVKGLFGGTVAGFVVADCHVRDPAELGGQVLNAGIVHHKSDLAECEFFVIDQLLDPFNFLKNDVTLQSYRLMSVENFRKVGIGIAQFLDKVIGFPDYRIHVVHIMDQFDHGLFDLFNQHLLPAFDQVKPDLRKDPRNQFPFPAVGWIGNHGLSQLYMFDSDPGSFKTFTDEYAAAIRDHVPDHQDFTDTFGFGHVENVKEVLQGTVSGIS